jgi:hypothetical protein
MAGKVYALKLTSDEVWTLQQQYAAAFTDLESRSKVEIRVGEKLDALAAQRHRDRQKSKA